MVNFRLRDRRLSDSAPTANLADIYRDQRCLFVVLDVEVEHYERVEFVVATTAERGVPGVWSDSRDPAVLAGKDRPSQMAWILEQCEPELSRWLAANAPTVSTDDYPIDTAVKAWMDARGGAS